MVRFPAKEIHAARTYCELATEYGKAILWEDDIPARLATLVNKSEICTPSFKSKLIEAFLLLYTDRKVVPECEISVETEGIIVSSLCTEHVQLAVSALFVFVTKCGEHGFPSIQLLSGLITRA